MGVLAYAGSPTEVGHFEVAVFMGDPSSFSVVASSTTGQLWLTLEPPVEERHVRVRVASGGEPWIA